MPFLGIGAYVLLAAAVGWLGRRRIIGFTGFFLLSLFLTPLLIALVLMIGAPRSTSS